MSTNIQVDVALASLLARIKAQQNAQRLAFLQKQEQLSFEEQVAQALKQQLPPELVPLQKREPRKEDLAAFRNTSGLDVTLAVAWIAGDRLYCGDGTQSVELPTLSFTITPPANLPLAAYSEVTEPPVPAGDWATLATNAGNPGPNTYLINPGTVYGDLTDIPGDGLGPFPNPIYFSDSASVVFPAGGERLIYAYVSKGAGAFNWHLWYTSVTDIWDFDLSLVIRDETEPWKNSYLYTDTSSDSAEGCYLVSRDSITSIAMPAAVRSRLYQQMYEYGTTTGLGAPSILSGSSKGAVPVQLVAVTGSAPTEGYDYYGIGGRISIYGFTIASEYAGSTPLMFDTFFDGLSAFGFDFTTWNSYSLIESNFSNTSKCTYTIEVLDRPGGIVEALAWRRPFYVGSSDVDGNDLRSPDATVRVSNLGVPSNLVSLSPERIVAWDWGNPTYCSQRLSLLGF